MSVRVRAVPLPFRYRDPVVSGGEACVILQDGAPVIRVAGTVLRMPKRKRARKAARAVAKYLGYVPEAVLVPAEREIAVGAVESKALDFPLRLWHGRRGESMMSDGHTLKAYVCLGWRFEAVRS